MEETAVSYTSTYLSNYMASGRMGSKPKTFMPSVVTFTFNTTNSVSLPPSMSVMCHTYLACTSSHTWMLWIPTCWTGHHNAQLYWCFLWTHATLLSSIQITYVTLSSLILKSLLLFSLSSTKYYKYHTNNIDVTVQNTGCWTAARNEHWCQFCPGVDTRIIPLDQLNSISIF